MSKQKLSLEDILDEYSTDEKNSQSKTTGNRLETEKILNSADKINAPPDSKEEKVKFENELFSHDNIYDLIDFYYSKLFAKEEKVEKYFEK